MFLYSVGTITSYQLRLYGVWNKNSEQHDHQTSNISSCARPPRHLPPLETTTSGANTLTAFLTLSIILLVCSILSLDKFDYFPLS